MDPIAQNTQLAMGLRRGQIILVPLRETIPPLRIYIFWDFVVSGFERRIPLLKTNLNFVP